MIGPTVAGRDPISRRTWIRIVLALAGTTAWASWWGSALAPDHAFGVWAAAIVLWAAAFYTRISIARGSILTVSLSLIVAALVVLRLVDLSTVPYVIEKDEVLHPLFGLEALRGSPWTVFGGVSHYYSTPLLTHVLQAVPCMVLPPLLGARLATVLLSLVSLIGTYALAGRLFGRGVACVSTVLLGASFWHEVYSRTGYPYMQAIAIVPIALYALIRGVTERHRLLQFLGGLLLGLSLLVYTSARIVIPVFAVWFAGQMALSSRPSRRPWRDAATAIIVIGIGAALMLSPYARTRGVTGVLFDRYQQTTLNPQAPIARLNAHGWISPEGVGLLWAQVRDAARVYYAPGAWLAVHSPSPSPLLDAVSLGLALVGLGLVVVGIHRAEYLLLAVWVAATFTLGQVFTDVPHAAYRAAPAIPALAISGGLAVAWAARRLRAWRPVPPGRQALALLGFAAAMVAINAPAVRAYHAQRTVDSIGSVARFIAAGPRDATYYLVGPEPLANDHILRFVTDGHTVHDVPSLVDALETGPDPGREAFFLIHFEMRSAAAIVRSCFPDATVVVVPGEAVANSLIAVRVPPSSRAACDLPANGGLLARYYGGGEWSGPVELERVERWPVRWGATAHDEPVRSVEWSGVLRIPAAGEYRFQLVNLNNAVGSATIGEAISLDSTHTLAASDFAAGGHPLRVRCRLGPAQVCWLRLARPGGDFNSLPPNWLSPAATSGIAESPAIGPPPGDVSRPIDARRSTRYASTSRPSSSAIQPRAMR